MKDERPGEVGAAREERRGGREGEEEEKDVSSTSTEKRNDTSPPLSSIPSKKSTENDGTVPTNRRESPLEAGSTHLNEKSRRRTSSFPPHLSKESSKGREGEEGGERGGGDEEDGGGEGEGSCVHQRGEELRIRRRRRGEAESP